MFLIVAFIEKNTWAGLEEFFLNLAQSLHVECEEMSYKENTTLNRSEIQFERNRADSPDSEDASEADIEGEVNSAKDTRELNVGKREAETNNTSLKSSSSKGKLLISYGWVCVSRLC